MATVAQALTALFAQIEADILTAMPAVETVILGAPREDPEGAHAVVGLVIENMADHALGGELVEFDAVSTITVRQPIREGTIVMIEKVAEASALAARLKSNETYAGIASMATVDQLDLEDSDDALIDDYEFAVVARFFVVAAHG